MKRPTKKHTLWVMLFVCVAAVIATLAAGWNYVLVRDYHRMMELAGNLAHEGAEARVLWLPLIFGTLGFAAALAITILFFVKILKEMRLNQMQSEFLAAVSHELKTPISSLKLTSQLLRSGSVPAEDAEKLWASHDHELERLRVDVEKILETSRYESQPFSLHRREFELEDWIQDSFERWKKILGPQAKIERTGDPLATKVKLDPHSLDLIAGNILTNSFKFAQGTPSVTVRTSLVAPAFRSGKARWTIEFIDEGWGFEPSDSKKIFDRFYRSAPVAPRAVPGTGLGLYLASMSGRLQGLRLTGSSEGRGKGAVFAVTGQGLPPEGGLR